MLLILNSGSGALPLYFLELSRKTRLFGGIKSLQRYCVKMSYIRIYKCCNNVLFQTMVWCSIYSAGRDEKLFPNHLKFDPDRWKRDETHAFAIQPFGYGPRNCYGMHF